jgi:thiol-disulfide isomerase/thioredoxin
MKIETPRNPGFLWPFAEMLAFLLLSSLFLSHPFSVTIDKQNVFEIIGKQNHVIVHFWADGCKHCLAFAPEWNEFVRMYHPVEGIVMATILCDKMGSLCTAFDGSGTPAVEYFAPRERKGTLYGGTKETLPLVKWVRELTSLDPYTSPGSLVFASPNEITDLAAGGWALVVADNPRDEFYNHTEIRGVEDKREVAVRALNNVNFEKERSKYCEDKLTCIVLVKGETRFSYDGAIERKAILEFIDAHIPPDL